MQLEYAVINGRKITALPFVLEALVKANNELEKRDVTHAGRKGLIFQAEITCSWRSLANQKQLVADGKSWTLYSNHRRGTAVDLFWEAEYLRQIEGVMAQFGLVNDLKKYGDAGHFNWKSNSTASESPIINSQQIIKKFSMNEYEGNILWETETSGSFALIQDGKRREISEKRAGKASLAVAAMGGKVVPVPLIVWESFPDGEKF